MKTFLFDYQITYQRRALIQAKDYDAAIERFKGGERDEFLGDEIVDIQEQTIQEIDE